MFEDPRFEAGTKHFIPQLKRMKDAGIEVYVGGGEGGTALENYGQPEWVTHCFTAGGTVLNALGSEPVPYLVSLRAAAKSRNFPRIGGVPPPQFGKTAARRHRYRKSEPGKVVGLTDGKQS